MQIEKSSIWAQAIYLLKLKGYIQSRMDHTLFIKHMLERKLFVLIVLVDDIIITGNDIVLMNSLNKLLIKEFEIKDLGQLRYFLGMEIAHSRNAIFVSQRMYVVDLLKELGMLGCKLSSTAMDTSQKLQSNESNLVDKGKYQRLV